MENEYNSHEMECILALCTVQTVLFAGGLLLHEVLPHHRNSTYGKIVFGIVSSAKEKATNLLLYKYTEPAIKDLECLKWLGEKIYQDLFQIRGPDQNQCEKGVELLKNGTFKKDMAWFMLTQTWNKCYAPIIGNKTHCVTHEGCVKM